MSGICSLALILTLTCSACLAHPFHISIAEMEYNAESKRIEVALKLHADDLERELERINSVEVDLESSQLADLAAGFLDRHFYLIALSSVPADSEQTQLDSGKPAVLSKVHFVGSELEKTWIWLYFELELLGPIVAEQDQDLALVNSVLLGRVRDQINTVRVRTGQMRHALKMTRKSPWQTFPAEWLKAATAGAGGLESTAPRNAVSRP